MKNDQKLKKYAVVLHIYYTEQWPYLKSYLCNLDGDFDLFVTLSSENAELTENIREFKPDALVQLAENKGYDIWPFFKVINNLNLDDYQYLVKLHTKRDMGSTIAVINKKYFFKGNHWRRLLLSFISNKDNFDKCLDCFESDSKVGLIANRMLIEINRPEDCNDHQLYCMTHAKDLLSKIGLKAYPDNEIQFIGGTMFICRAHLFKPLQKLNLKVDDFSVAVRKKEDDMAHVVERLFGWVVTSQGYTITDPFSTYKDDLKMFCHNRLCRFLTFKLRHRWFSKSVRFLFRIDEKTDGRNVVRILKIPVFSYNRKI